MRLVSCTLTLLFILGVARIGLSQEMHPILDRYDAISANNQVQITCIISSGSTCNGINVLRSSDSLNYSSIGNIGGVCGNSNSPITYQFTDSVPLLNIPNYYKLELGGFGFTQVVSVTIRKIKENQLQILPNPANIIANIHFENSKREKHILYLFDTSGALIFTNQTNDTFFEVNTSNLITGVYSVSIQSLESNNVKFGKLSITH